MLPSRGNIRLRSINPIRSWSSTPSLFTHVQLPRTASRHILLISQPTFGQAVLPSPVPGSVSPSTSQHSPLGAQHPCVHPLCVPAWRQALLSHPDQEWVDHLISGLQNGFRIGLRADPVVHSSRGNSPSAVAHPQVISPFLQDQVQAGFMVGPLPASACLHISVARMAVVPKKSPGKILGHRQPLCPRIPQC